jgi:hypothetical protein
VKQCDPLRNCVTQMAEARKKRREERLQVNDKVSSRPRSQSSTRSHETTGATKRWKDTLRERWCNGCVFSFL